MIDSVNKGSFGLETWLAAYMLPGPESIVHCVRYKARKKSMRADCTGLFDPISSYLEKTNPLALVPGMKYMEGEWLSGSEFLPSTWSH